MSDYMYKNELLSLPLVSTTDITGWRMEGEGIVSFPNGRMRLEGTMNPTEGQKANSCSGAREFPDHISITWDFYPVAEPGLCIVFFAARGGQRDRDLFDPSLAPRTGSYP